MKRLKFPFEIVWLFLISICFFLGCKSPKNEDSQQQSSADNESWNLIFEEEFDDLSAWNIWYGGAYNNEIQLYRGEQLSIDSGMLHIHALRKSIMGPTLPTDTNPKNFEYVSGRIESKQTFGPSDKAGESVYRFMARIKLPFGHGMWPAFWSYGDPWPTQGEIDILEARGGVTNKFNSNIYYGPKDGININHDTEAKFTVEQNLTEDFHVLEMIWYADSINILLDHQLMYTYTANSNNNIDKLFGKKQKVVLNTAVGGWFFEDQNSSNYADSSTMIVDWVRVYKK